MRGLSFIVLWFIYNVKSSFFLTFFFLSVWRFWTICFLLWNDYIFGEVMFFILMFSVTIKFSDKSSFALRSYHIVQGSCIWRPRRQTTQLPTTQLHRTHLSLLRQAYRPSYITLYNAVSPLLDWLYSIAPTVAIPGMTSGGVSLWLTPLGVGCATGRGILSIPSRALFRYDGVCDPHVIPIATMVYCCYRSHRSHLDSS